MPMNGDIEKAADEAYRRAGFGLGAQAPVVLLAQRILGERAVRQLPQSVMVGTGALVRVGSHWRIYVREESPAHVKRFSVLHELAHYLLGQSATESECDQLAAALLLPREAFRRYARPRAMWQAARVFGASETCAWRRVGETFGDPVAVVTPRRVHLSGPKHPWPSESAIRMLATESRPKGLRKCLIRDDRDRAALRAVAL